MNKGLVIKSTGSWYYVIDEQEARVACKIKGKFRMEGLRATNPVAVGDQVSFDKLEDGTGIITEIGSRKNYIIRKSSNLSREYQLIATNIDQALLMVSLTQPKTLPGFIDRFLVAAEAFRIPVVILFNKIDIYSGQNKAELDHLVKTYEQIPYKCLAVSIEEKINMEALSEVINQKITVISGNSGVGKTTLINYMDPSLNLRTEEISESHKLGQHTTTYAEMFFLPGGGKIIDTPGIKGFGTVDIEKDELFHFFPEIFRLSSGCKFHNCMHVNEPGCKVIEAVLEKVISETRYLNYLDMLEDMGDKYRK